MDNAFAMAAGSDQCVPRVVLYQTILLISKVAEMLRLAPVQEGVILVVFACAMKIASHPRVEFVDSRKVTLRP
jgi:hypothetical protein